MKKAHMLTLATGIATATFALGGFTKMTGSQSHYIMGSLTGSRNWAGYVDQSLGTPYTEMTGSWNVPVISGQRQAADAQWIGLGGVQTEDLLQIGTLETMQNGKQVDEVFWEKLPGASVPILEVYPGEQIKADIKYIRGNQWRLDISAANHTQSTTRSINVTVSPRYAQQMTKTADWISEDPENEQHQIVPLASSQPVVFSQATVNQKPISQADAITHGTVMVGTQDTEVVAPSALGHGGTTFSTHSVSQSISISPPSGWPPHQTGTDDMPSITIPATAYDVTQTWAKLRKIDRHMYAVLHRWDQAVQFPPASEMHWPQVFNFNPGSLTGLWSGAHNGWRWTIRVFTN